ncbi:MAG: site-specific integrase [bacterium]|nr:site-specific integrase [bacterium]
MRGSIHRRGKGRYAVIIEMGYHPDPETGQLKRRQKWFTVRGTKREAEAKLAELLHQASHGALVEPTKLTFGQWLDEWIDTAIKPPNKRQRTHETYKSVSERHLKPALGTIRLQQLHSTDLQRYYSASSLSPATLEQHHIIIHSALKAAEMQGLVARNVAKLVINKPRRKEGNSDAMSHCWPATEAQRFLAVVDHAGPQMALFYRLALDTGARKGELCGLKWGNVDLEAGRVSIVRQLIKPGAPPLLGPPKNGKPRTIELMPLTVKLLRQHKVRQAALKLANGSVYQDFGLVFAKDWWGMTRHSDTLGHPLQSNSIGQREFKRLIAEAGVKPIKFHGLRHTCATLMLQAGVPAHVVQERLGHKKIEITLDIYAHALPSMQEDAATRLADLLEG